MTSRTNATVSSQPTATIPTTLARAATPTPVHAALRRPAANKPTSRSPGNSFNAAASPQNTPPRVSLPSCIASHPSASSGTRTDSTWSVISKNRVGVVNNATPATAPATSGEAPTLRATRYTVSKISSVDSAASSTHAVSYGSNASGESSATVNGGSAG